MKKENEIERLNSEVKKLRKEVDELKSLMRELVQVVFNDDEDDLDEKGPFPNN
ncbi:MAG: hypothetical protein ACP5G5_01300 [Thermoplasmata archaeon]|jgi:uncharacterized coiled-coil protein SlyX